MNILKSFSEFAFPRNCELCGRPVDRPGRQLCSACLMRIPVADGRNVDYAEFDGADFDRVSCALRLEGDAKRMTYGFKFSGKLWLRDDLVDFMQAAVQCRLNPTEVDCVVPVPITLAHRIDRGGFPVGELAVELARRLQRRYLPRTLARCGHPKRQSSLSREERLANLRGTVKVRGERFIRGRTVLLVDDILTTGATLSECARVLKLAGAWRVWALSLGRAIRS